MKKNNDPPIEDEEKLESIDDRLIWQEGQITISPPPDGKETEDDDGKG